VLGFRFTSCPQEQDNNQITIRVNNVNSETLSILVADDHPLFREALQQILSLRYPDAMLYAAANVTQLQQQVDAHPDIALLLLDLHMPGALGFSALSWFVGHHRNTPVIMISANSHPDTVRRAIDHGVAGFLSKSAEIPVMQSCIEAALAGERGMHPELDASSSGASLQSLDVAEALSTLTPQQFRVVSMLFDGLLNKQIAYELEVKEATVKAHMTEIFRKLGVRSRTQAVLALRSLSVDAPASLVQAPAP
jgi:DNA-binding NarL/FixJ family response regulator